MAADADGSVWTDKSLEARLVAMWEEGVTTAEMARQLSTEEVPITKNAVIGKVRRLGLPMRVEKSGKSKPVRASRRALEDLKAGSCAWPMGHPPDPEFHFCGASPVVLGKPYCEHHCAVAYEKPKPYVPKVKDVA